MPTTCLLDTNTITALAKERQEALDRLQGLDPGDRVYTCFIVVGEWEYGIRNAQGEMRQAAIRLTGEPVFAAIREVWQSSPAISEKYGELHALLRSRGQMIPTNDIWIAATALVHQATLVSTDPHFGRVPGLVVNDWTRP